MDRLRRFTRDSRARRRARNSGRELGRDDSRLDFRGRGPGLVVIAHEFLAVVAVGRDRTYGGQSPDPDPRKIELVALEAAHRALRKKMMVVVPLACDIARPR